MIRSLLFQASMPARYWLEGLHTAMYMLNHLPCKAINISYPYVTLYSVAPSYERLHVFNCVCYPNLSAQAAHKSTQTWLHHCLDGFENWSQEFPQNPEDDC
jgi:hypothetical protein